MDERLRSDDAGRSQQITEYARDRSVMRGNMRAGLRPYFAISMLGLREMLFQDARLK